MLTKDNVETDENVECYHTNFTEGEVLHKIEKTDYITYQIICKDCGKHLDLTWKLWSVEDLDQNKILYHAKENKNA
jgi:UDP-N-acetylglucosamine pyrophosphorylase